MSLYIDTLESQIKNWLQDPKAGEYVAGRNWLGLCQALMYQLCAKFGTAKVVYNPATAAMKASGKLNTDVSKAPIGAFHYWKYISGGVDKGHVVFDLAGGGTRVLTASSYASPQWGKNAGVSSVDRINHSLGKSNYLGWAMSNGKNTAPVKKRPVEPEKPAPPVKPIPPVTHPVEPEKPIEPPVIPPIEEDNKLKQIIEKISKWIIALFKGEITISEIGYSVIRTGVPIAWSWLFFIAAERFEWISFVPVDVQTEITAIIAGVLGTLWYALIRVLAKKWPALERLLGASKAPTYTDPISEQEYEALRAHQEQLRREAE